MPREPSGLDKHRAQRFCRHRDSPKHRPRRVASRVCLSYPPHEDSMTDKTQKVHPLGRHEHHPQSLLLHLALIRRPKQHVRLQLGSPRRYSLGRFRSTHRSYHYVHVHAHRGFRWSTATRPRSDHHGRRAALRPVRLEPVLDIRQRWHPMADLFHSQPSGGGRHSWLQHRGDLARGAAGGAVAFGLGQVVWW